MDNNSTIPSQLGPMSTMPSRLDPVSPRPRGSQAPAISPMTKLLWLAAVVAVLLTTARYLVL